MAQSDDMHYKQMVQHRRLVLVVDDQEINQGILEAILEDDYEVIFANNGVEALEAMEANLHRLSIVLLDLLMPVMNGFEVLERVRGDDRLKPIPIIVLTAEKQAELKALQLGAADFITKPFDNHEVILARVGRMIELSEGRQLISATEFDSVTQLYTSGFFFQYAEQIAHLHPEWHMGAIVLDIDHFHTVNDLNGRTFGDEVLKVVADGIRDVMANAPNAVGIASRVEADKFYVYCRSCDNCGDVLERLQERVDALSGVASIRLRMGVCLWAEGLMPVEAFDRAKAACNIIRGDYTTQLLVYDEALHEREIYEQRLLNDLNHAVEDRQFLVYFQPKYDIRGDQPRLASAEALVRWRHPELGMISPGDFIPLFENNGLINVVDGYVWEEAAHIVASWREKHGIELPISVNVSRSELYDQSLENHLCRIIDENGLMPVSLKLEVTESVCAGSAEELIAALDHLRDLGFQIEMDDFGTGYSSLNMISILPIDVLKLDMRFIQNVREDGKSFRLIELVLDIAKYLGVPVVAEGVETQEQLELLKKAGCDLVQGFCFSPPIPAEKFEELLVSELASA